MVVIDENSWILYPSPATMWINIISSAFGVVHHIALFTYVVYRNYRSSELDPSHTLRKPLLVWTLCAIGFYIPFQIGMFMSTINYFADHLTCYHIYKITWLPYWMGKYSCWMYSVMRIKVAFHDSQSVFALPKWGIPAIEALFTMFVLWNMFVFGPLWGWKRWAISGKLIHVNDELEDCIVVLPLPVIFLSFLWDTIAVCLCYYLFQRGINKLLAMSRVHDAMSEEQRAKDMRNPNSAIFRSNLLRGVLGKYKMLLVTVVVTSWIASTISTFNALAGIMATTDCIINMWCLVMFDARFRNHYFSIYSRLCAKCIKPENLGSYELDSTKWVPTSKEDNSTGDRSVPKPQSEMTETKDIVVGN